MCRTDLEEISQRLTIGGTSESISAKNLEWGTEIGTYLRGYGPHIISRAYNWIATVQILRDLGFLCIKPSVGVLVLLFVRRERAR